MKSTDLNFFFIKFSTPVSLLDHLSEFKIKLGDSVLEISIYLFKLGSNAVNFFICALNLSCNRLNPMIKVLQNSILCCCILSLPIEDGFKRARFFQLSNRCDWGLDIRL